MLNEALYCHQQNQSALARLAPPKPLSPEEEAKGVYNALMREHRSSVSCDALSASLLSLGFEEVGRGAFSKAYRRGRLICKIGTDRAYTHFASLALENQQNPFYPRIYYHEVLRMRRKRGVHITFMEPLVPTDGFSCLMDGLQDDAVLLSGLLSGDLPIDQSKEKPETCAVVHQIHKRRRLGFFRGALRMDAHMGNIMYRPERKELVVTDPYAR